MSVCQKPVLVQSYAREGAQVHLIYVIEEQKEGQCCWSLGKEIGQRGRQGLDD